MKKSLIEFQEEIVKKINFIKEFSKESKITVKTVCSWVENIKNKKFDFVIAGPLLHLKKSYIIHLFLQKKTKVEKIKILLIDLMPTDQKNHLQLSKD